MGITADNADQRPAAWLAGLVAAAVTALIYALTLATDVGYHDAAELALRAAQLGATHSPGAPLHTLLGHFLIAFGLQPALATAWLSLLTGALTAGILGALLIRLGIEFWLATTGGVVFALIAVVWTNAVTTELYTLSLLFVGLSLFAVFAWSHSGARSAWAAVFITYWLALAAHFANIILLPAYLILVWSAVNARLRSVCLFLLFTGLAIAIIAGANALLAARVLPFGPFIPDSLAGIFSYMSGAEHDPLGQQGTKGIFDRLGFSLNRISEHVSLFARNYFYIGLFFILAGAVQLIRRHLPSGLFAALVFAGSWSYFTLFGPGDYFLMVGPTYMVASLWFIVGLQSLMSLWLHIRNMRWLPLVPGVMAVVMLGYQFEPRRASAQLTAPRDYAERAFAALPAGSLAVVRWNEFTVMRYLQFIEGRRPDINLVIPARTPRHYRHGIVPDYLELVKNSICDKPVYTNKAAPELLLEFATTQLEGEDLWLHLQPADLDAC